MTLWRVRATVDDRPGYLAVLTASLALRSVNILAVQVHTTEGGAVDDFLIDAPDQLTESELVAAVERGRGRDAWVSRADAHGLVDLPTQAIGLAGRLVHDPDALGAVLGTMVGGEVSWRPAPGGSGYGLTGATMRLPDPAGGCYLVTREAPAFTPAEYARAQALVDLAVVAGRQAVARDTLLLPDGAELEVRLATPEDLDAVAALHRRCSATTRYQRYLTGTTGPGPAQLARLLAPAHGLALVVEIAEEAAPGPTSGPAADARGGAGAASPPTAGTTTLDSTVDPPAGAGPAPAGAPRGDSDGGEDREVEGERIVALANLIGEGAIAEVAILVEDAWQRRGIGTTLLRRLVRLATRAGYAALVVHTLAENAAMLGTLRRLGREQAVESDGPMLTITLALRGQPAGASAMGVAGQGRAVTD